VVNLLEETKRCIRNSGHKISDIVFMGSEESGYSCTWKEFTRLANVEYDAGYGAAKVATDFIVVFEDGTKMWRGEYDGAEWWAYSTPFKEPKEKKRITSLFGEMWDNLKDIHEERE